ncbi:MAG: hypothetical protein M3325_17360, partial [Actinomycetota bacterium]|nr:hypothetical protein [Actinomycetota bacterium]
MSAIVAAVAALLGVVYGSKLVARREATNWIRDQRLAAYTELLTAVESCYNAFTLLAAHLRARDYESSRQNQCMEIRKLMENWGTGDKAIERHVTVAELVASDELAPFLVGSVRHGVRERHRVLLMKFDYMQEVDAKEWRVEGHTHEMLMRVRIEFRRDLRRTME